MNWAEQRLAVIGCGVMAQCLVDGWLKNKIFVAERMTLTDAYPAGLEALKTKYPKCQVSCDNLEAVKGADVVLLSVKPFMVRQVLQEILNQDRSAFNGKILISIAAGLKLSLYHSLLGGADVTIIRAMPNIACRVDHGMTAVCADSAADSIKIGDASILKATESIFKPLGGWMLVEDEKLMDVVTALNGSALAFGCMAIEAMADGAVSMGLPRAQALNLASHALLAASSLQIGTGEHPAVLRDQITTPGGCTIAGLLTLEEGNFRSVLAKAVQETTRVSSELDISPGMGAKPSKPTPSVPLERNYDAEKQLGKDIVDKIKLKTSTSDSTQFQQFKSTKFAKRLEMDAQTEGTVSWTDLPALFSQPATTEARKLVQKCFKLVTK